MNSCSCYLILFLLLLSFLFFNIPFFRCSSPYQIQHLQQSAEDEDGDKIQPNGLTLLARTNTHSTLNSTLLLNFELCGGLDYGTGDERTWGSDEHLALQKLSLMHGLALASVTYLPIFARFNLNLWLGAIPFLGKLAFLLSSYNNITLLFAGTGKRCSTSKVAYGCWWRKGNNRRRNWIWRVV